MRGSDIMLNKVINVVDGIYLGNVIDYDIDTNSGLVNSIIVEQEVKRKLFSFSKGEHELVILFSNIVTIGDDVILVKYGKDENFVI